MLGLLPGDIDVTRRTRPGTIPDDVRQELDRLKALYSGFHYRELARIVFCKCAYPLDDKTAKLLWQQSPVPTQQQLELWTYHTHPDRYQARLQVIKLSDQGWDKLSISRFLQVSRPTVDTWIARFGHVADLYFTPMCAMLLIASEGERHGTHFRTLSSLSQRSSHQRRQDQSWATTL
jgi:Homeodomain-like domain